MTLEQFQELKTEVKTEIASTVRVVVNGKIDHLTQEVGSLHEKIEGVHHRLDSQDLAIAPALETIRTFQSGRKFMVFMLPVFAFVGAIIAWIKG